MEKACRRSPVVALEAEAALFLRADELKTKESHAVRCCFGASR